MTREIVEAYRAKYRENHGITPKLDEMTVFLLIDILEELKSMKKQEKRLLGYLEDSKGERKEMSETRKLGSLEKIT